MSMEERPLRVETIAHPLEHARSIVEILAFILAALWGLYVFAYQEIIKPANEPPRLEESVSVTHSSLGMGDVFVTVRVQYQNPGKSEVDLAAEALSVWGRRVEGRDAHVSTGSAAWDVDRSRALGERRLILDSGLFRDAVVTGIRGKRFVIAAGASVTQEYTFVVPRGRYDLIEVAYDTWFLRSNYGSRRINLIRRIQADGSSTIERVPRSGGAETYSSVGGGSFPLSDDLATPSKTNGSAQSGLGGNR